MKLYDELPAALERGVTEEQIERATGLRISTIRGYSRMDTPCTRLAAQIHPLVSADPRRTSRPTPYVAIPVLEAAQERGVTRSAMGRAIGVTYRTMCRYFSGDRRIAERHLEIIDNMGWES